MDEWTVAIDAMASWLAAGNTRPATIRLHCTYLRRLASDRSPWSLTIDDIAAFLANDRWGPETRKSARSAVRALYRYGIATGKIDRDPSAGLPRLRVPPGEPRPASEGLVVRALAMAPTGRERLMVMLAAYEGLRRGEIACVHTDDVEGGWLRVHGKGGKVRRVPLCDEVADALAALPPGFVFRGKIDGHLSANRVGVILSRLLGQASGHQLRHRFSSTAHARGADLLTLTRLLGHSRPETTMRYTVTPDRALEQAVLAASS